MRFLALSMVRYSEKLEDTTFRKDGLNGRDPVNEVSFSEGIQQRGCLPSSSPSEGNRSNFRKVVFSSYLEYLKVDKVQKQSDYEIRH
jgi:hypothetical protein